MRSGLVATVLLVCLLWSLPAHAQTSAFTYQGRITDGVSAANGPYDLQFALFTLSSGGAQVGGTLTQASVTVSNGTFTVQLDFGDVFPGVDRFLEIRIKKPAEGLYTTLTPRQRITSAPYAVRALSASTLPASAGNNIITAINDAATGITINENRLSISTTGFVRINPVSQQVSPSDFANGSDPLLDLRGTHNDGAAYVSDFKFLHSGGFVMSGYARDVGNTTGCASFIPATGAGTRFMWHPCRGSVRFGRAPIGPGSTTWDDANMDDFTFAGGNQVIASDYGAFAYGDQVTVSSTVGVGFGSGVTVSGTAGFSAGASNVCSGFTCVAIGYSLRATGQGSVALGYRTAAAGDYTVALGHRAATCSLGADGMCVAGTERRGSFVWGDEVTTFTSVADHLQSQADNEFRIRAKGGVRLRVSAAANNNTPGAGGNVGCDLTVAVPSWTCASSRDVKENFADVDGESVLRNLRRMPVSTFSYTGDSGKTRHLGPVAEDFYAAFALGDSDKSINAQNMAGVSLAAVKALEDRTAHLQQANDELRTQLQRQQDTIGALTKLICAGMPGAAVCQ
jgi:hypothetical protein